MPVKGTKGGYNTAKGKEVSSKQLPVPRGTKTSITEGVIHSNEQAGVPVRKV